MEAISGFVLAGGASTRMGTDKALLDWHGQPLVEHALALLRSVTPEVRIVGQQLKFGAFGTTVEDLFPGRGPLGGIHVALAATAADLNLVLAVDMPFVPPEFLSYLAEQARQASAAVTVPRLRGRWQPLCAVYRRTFGAVAEASLRGGRNKIDALFSSLEVRAIDESELHRLALEEDIFDNVNTRADWEQAARRAHR